MIHILFRSNRRIMMQMLRLVPIQSLFVLRMSLLLLQLVDSIAFPLRLSSLDGLLALFGFVILNIL